MTRPPITYNAETNHYEIRWPNEPGGPVAMSSSLELLEQFVDYLETREGSDLSLLQKGATGQCCGEP